MLRPCRCAPLSVTDLQIMIKLKNLLTRDLNANTDLLVLPEVWTVGWSCEDFPAAAEELVSSDTINFLSDIAKKYNVNILGGSFIQKQGNAKCLNTCPGN